MICYVAPALLKCCSLAFAICKCLCIFPVEVICLPLAPDSCSVSLKSDVQLCFYFSPKTAAQNILMSVFIWSSSFASPFLHSSGPPPPCRGEGGHFGPPPASRVSYSLDIQGLRLLRELTPGSVARTRQLCITSWPPQYFAEAVFWELSTLPSFCSLTTKGLAIKKFGCKAF